MALLLLDAWPVALVEALKHLVDVERDEKFGNEPSLALVAKHEARGHMLDEARARSLVGESQREALARVEPITTECYRLRLAALRARGDCRCVRAA